MNWVKPFSSSSWSISIFSLSSNFFSIVEASALLLRSLGLTSLFLGSDLFKAAGFFLSSRSLTVSEVKIVDHSQEIPEGMRLHRTGNSFSSSTGFGHLHIITLYVECMHKYQ